MEVRFLHSAAELAPWREQMEALNQASARRCLFSSPGVLETFLDCDAAVAPRGAAEPWIAVALQDGRLRGYLALRRAVERVGGFPAPKLEPLITVETDRPHPVARSEDLPAVCAALWRSLLALPRRDWTLLELPMQDQAAELVPPPGLGPPGLFLRRLPCRPVSVVALPGTFEGWFAGLGHGQRHNARRQLRLLLDLGPVSFLSAPEGAPEALLDLYLDLERRSWKAHDDGSASLHRHPERVEYYRRLLRQGGPLQAGFELLLLHGQPVAAKMVASYGGQLYHLHTAYDAGCAGASPGSTLVLLSMRRAMARGFRRVNLMPDFAYAKRRWGAEVTETERLQLFRTFSPHGLKALAGSARRRLRAARRAAPPDRNPSRLAAERARPAEAAPAPPAAGHPLDPRLAAAAALPGAEHLDAAAALRALACVTGGR